jgi:aspartyl-tRNA(Asn)/glutamyl-tRNA(Gln) amidotransferase subunit B
MLDLTYEAPKPKVIAGAKGDWELVIGMEIHAQVASNAKLFSGASTAFGAEPNSNVAFVDAACRGCCRSSTNSAWNRRCAPGWG